MSQLCHHHMLPWKTTLDITNLMAPKKRSSSGLRGNRMCLSNVADFLTHQPYIFLFSDCFIFFQFFNLVIDSLITFQFNFKFHPTWLNEGPTEEKNNKKKKWKTNDQTKLAHCDCVSNLSYEFSELTRVDYDWSNMS